MSSKKKLSFTNEEFIIVMKSKGGDNTNINLGKIKLGHIYKDYRELIDGLKLNYTQFKSGNSKQALMKILNKRTEYTRGVNGARDYMFTKIKIEPTINMALTKRLQLIKLSLIQSMIEYNENVESHEKGISLSWKYLQENLGMINYNYIKYQNNHSVISDSFNMDDSIVSDFYDNTYTVFKRSIIRALDSLQDDDIIRWAKTFYISYSIQKGNNVVYKEGIVSSEELSRALSAKTLAIEEIYYDIIYKGNESKIIERKRKDIEDIDKGTVMRWLYKNDKWQLYYSLINKHMSNLLSEYYNSNIKVNKLYEVVNIVNNLVVFSEYKIILDKYNFSRYKLTNTVSKDIIQNAKSRIGKAEVSKTQYNDSIEDNIYEPKELTSKEKTRLGIDFFSNFIKIVEFCITREVELPEGLKKLTLK